MAFELTGRLIEKYDAQQMNENFRKRDFVIEVITNYSGNQFSDFIKFQLTQDRCNLLDLFKINDYIRVNFNIKGRKWEKEGNINYFNTMDAWRIEKVDDYDLRPFDDNLVVPESNDVPF
ncbi:MAG: DUF3127 domain-containing protein [Candidatus Kapabacteria bacterium]|nr:DUF3127 domain-containing protein [Ignavibacteriota bacterium]MCW5884659.1 DUF3127 domain-containing protein [Candidatus Kapabacteria bacterium]